MQNTDGKFRLFLLINKNGVAGNSGNALCHKRGTVFPRVLHSPGGGDFHSHFSTGYFQKLYFWSKFHSDNSFKYHQTFSLMCPRQVKERAFKCKYPEIIPA